MHILNSLTTANVSRRKPAVQIPSPEKGRGLNRWTIYKQLCIAKASFGLNDRCLAVLSSLLSFYPDDELSIAKGLVVFPSNKQLCLRAHGMPESTLRRHLASLIAAGIIARKDSPTRKRYAHKDKAGTVELAFGFSVEPLLLKASAITQAAEQITHDIKTLKRLRDEVSIIRREITSTFSETVRDVSTEKLEALFTSFRDVVNSIPRRTTIEVLRTIKTKFHAILNELDKILNSNVIVSKLSGSNAHIERQQYESLPESQYINNRIQKCDLLISNPIVEKPNQAQTKIATLPLQTVLQACPDIASYSTAGIKSWRELLNTSHIVSKFLGIGQQLWVEALAVIGLENTGSVVAWLLQKGAEVQSPGGYLRSLLVKARAGEWSVGSMLMAGLKNNRSSFNTHTLV